MVGSTIQDKFFEHFLKFCMYKYALTADIEKKVYLQVLVHPDDWKYQQNPRLCD